MVTHRGADLPCLDDLRKANQERLVQGFFIHPLLVVEAVLTEGEALVRGVDDDGVVGEAALVQVVEDAADVVIHVFDKPVVTLDVNLIELGEQFLVGDVGVLIAKFGDGFFEVRSAQDQVGAHGLLDRLRSAAFVVIIEGGGFGDGDVGSGSPCHSLAGPARRARAVAWGAAAGRRAWFCRAFALARRGLRR